MQQSDLTMHNANRNVHAGIVIIHQQLKYTWYRVVERRGGVQYSGAWLRNNEVEALEPNANTGLVPAIDICSLSVTKKAQAQVYPV